MWIFGTRALLLRRFRFIGINVAVMALFAVLVIGPLASEVMEQGEAIADRAEQLSRLTAIAASARQLANGAGKTDDLYLPSSEERLASADLQANLKTVAETSGLRFLGARAATPKRLASARMVAVGIDLEGGPVNLRDALTRIETARPILFVTSLVLRPATGADGALRAELTVQGAMRDAGSRAAVAEQGP